MIDTWGKILERLVAKRLTAGIEEGGVRWPARFQDPKIHHLGDHRGDEDRKRRARKTSLKGENCGSEKKLGVSRNDEDDPRLSKGQIRDGRRKRQIRGDRGCPPEINTEAAPVEYHVLRLCKIMYDGIVRLRLPMRAKTIVYTDDGSQRQGRSQTPGEGRRHPGDHRKWRADKIVCEEGRNDDGTAGTHPVECRMCRRAETEGAGIAPMVDSMSIP